MKKFEKHRRCWKPKISKFAECDGGEAAGSSSAASGGEIGVGSSDVLGSNCNHVENGYFSDGCFHKPSKCKVPFYRWAEPANGGSKRKKNKHGKPKKTPYEKDMKIVHDDF